MRDIAKIIEDDRKGKELSQTERQIAVAYVQGKYDAVRELKINNNSKVNDVLDKIREEIKLLSNANPSYWHSGDMVEREEVLEIIDKYKESEVIEC